MDPITAAVVALVFWLFIRSIISVAIVLVFLIVGGAAGKITGYPSVGIPFVVVGYLSALAWEVFAIIQVILEIIRIVQLVNA